MKIFISCPSNSTTGGAENLHQIGNAIQELGKEAYINYYPDKSGGSTAEFFKNYELEVGTPEDHINNLIIIPELNTGLAKNYHNAKIVISWLSVDNYFQKKRQSPLRDEYVSLKRLLRGHRLPFIKLRNFGHISQSNYATTFLSKKNIKSDYVGDYINQDFVVNKTMAINKSKENVVLYNPKKGQRFNEFVIANNPDIDFKPLVNYSRSEMIDILQKSKVYMDLGHHPGKDRIPREAAISGCCILTSTAGSAGNIVDVPISSDNKFDLNKKSLSNIGGRIAEIFNNYGDNFGGYAKYIKIIENEKSDFSENILKFINKYEK